MTDKDDREYWIRLDSDMRRLLEECSTILSEESVAAVRHYIDVSEYEMAFEGLFIDLMKVDRMPKNIDLTKCRELSLLLGLDSETVLDDDFWPKFTRFLRQTKIGRGDC